MIQRESHFQYLVALAVAGQISDAELEELAEHMAECFSCSQRMAEMESTNLKLFLTLAAQVKGSRVSSPVRERFWIRVAHSGVPTTAPSSMMQRLHLLQFAPLLVAVCLFVGMGWRHITDRSSGQTMGSPSTTKIGAAPQLPATARLDFAAPVAGLPFHKRRNHTTGNVATLKTSARDGEVNVITRPLFRLDPAFLPSQPGALNTEAKLSGIQHLPAEYFSLREERPTPRFSGTTLGDSSVNSVPDPRVFHYSATLASVSLQDDQAVFGLKPRVRDLFFSNMLDSTRSR